MAYIIVTVNNSTIRGEMNDLDSSELVASQGTFICWHMTGSNVAADIATAEGLAGYLGIVQID